VMGVFFRTVKGKTSKEVRYMMSDLPCEEVQRLGCCFRNPWGIENRLHWVLDVSFGEDGNRTRRGNGAENLGKLRRLVHGLLLKVKGKQTVPKTMFRAALSPNYRTTVVEQIVKNKSDASALTSSPAALTIKPLVKTSHVCHNEGCAFFMFVFYFDFTMI